MQKTNTEAERWLLGAILKDNSVLLPLKGLLPKHFEKTANRIVFEAILSALDADGAADLVTVQHNLKLKGKLENAGGAAYLSELTSEVPATENAGHYAKIVQEEYRRREADHALTTAREALRNGEPVDKALQHIEEIEDPGRPIPMITAAELFEKEFAPLQWVIPDILPSGLSLLCGKQKLGKSWMMLQIAYSVAAGGAVFGEIAVEARPVLYIALEDGERRLQSRLLKIGAAPTDNLHFATSWRTGAEAVGDIDNFIATSGVKIIIVDTLARLRLLDDSNDYVDTTAQLARLKAVADKHDACIVCVHHVRKSTVDDFTDSVIGSVGIAATADSVLVLQRTRGQNEAKLSVTGRDIEEDEYILSFDATVGSWCMVGKAQDIQATSERQEIVNLLIDAELPLTPKEVAAALGKNLSTTQNLLSKMYEAGAVLKPTYGHYSARKSVVSVESVVSCMNNEVQDSTDSMNATLSIDTTLSTHKTEKEEETTLFKDTGR